MASAFDLSSLLSREKVAIEVARRVGMEAAVFRVEALPETLGVENKGLQDFVTVADKRAEEEIRAALLSEFPDDSFMGEEGGGIQGNTAPGWSIRSTAPPISSAGSATGASRSPSSPAARSWWA